MRHRRVFLAAMVLVAAGALALRLHSLGIRPFHGDEAVHAFKFLELWKQGVYRYDHNEFHGPTLYYAALPSIWLHGRRLFADCTEADFRLPIVLFGAAMALVIAPLSSGLGRRAVFCAGLFTAVSPALVFYSRYYIQETILAFFTLSMLVCGWKYAESRKTGWLLLAGASAGLMIASKETAVLAFAAMAGALLLTRLWRRWVDRDTASPGPPLPPAPMLAALGIALLVACLLLSGFGSNHEGPLGILTGPVDYLKSYTPWLQRAKGASLHVYPWNYYFQLIIWTHRGKGPAYSEVVIVALAVLGALSALMPRQSRNSAGGDVGAVDEKPSGDGSAEKSGHAGAAAATYGTESSEKPGDETGSTHVGAPTVKAREWDASGRVALARFVAFYTILLTALYCVIPYKTPWCLINFLSGMILLAGVGAIALITRARSAPVRMALYALLLAGCVQLQLQAHRAGFQTYTDPDNPYVYSQPVSDVENLSRWTSDVARYSGVGHAMLVKVIWVDDYHWPIAWYLRQFDNIQHLEGFYHDTSDPSAPLVLASPEFEDELTKKLDKTHVMARFFGIRPGTVAQAWVRMDIWERYLKNRPRPKDDE